MRDDEKTWRPDGSDNAAGCFELVMRILAIGLLIAAVGFGLLVGVCALM